MTETRAPYITLRGNQNARKPPDQKARQHQFRLYPQSDKVNLTALMVAWDTNATEVVRQALAVAVRRCLLGDYGSEIKEKVRRALAEAAERQKAAPAASATGARPATEAAGGIAE